MSWHSSEKKTCFVLDDGEIGYPGDEPPPGSPEQPHTPSAAAAAAAALPQALSVPNSGGSSERLKSPPPASSNLTLSQGWDTTASVPQMVAEWRCESVLAPGSGSDTSSEDRPPSRTTSLRSCGRSPTPSMCGAFSDGGATHTSDKEARQSVPPALPAAKLDAPSSTSSVSRKRRRKDRGSAGAAKRRRGSTAMSSDAGPDSRDTLPADGAAGAAEDSAAGEGAKGGARSHFLQLPAEVLRPLCGFCTFADIVALQQTCVALRRLTPPCMEVLDLSGLSCLNRTFSTLLMRLSLEGMRLRCISLSAEIRERFCGVIGFIMKSSPHLRTVELAGFPKIALIREISKYCPHLKEFLQISVDRGDDTGPDTSPPNSNVLSYILKGSKALHTVTLGRTVLQGWNDWGDAECSCSHVGLRKLRLERLSAGAFSEKCVFPNLTSLSIFEGPDASLNLKNVLAVLWNSPSLTELTLAATFRWAPDDIATLQSRCPELKRLRLKSGNQGAERWSSQTPTAQVSRVTFDALFCTFPQLQELCIEAAGWDPHWTAYHDLVGANALVLQTELQSLEMPLLKHLRTHAGLRQLSAVVLYGDVTNAMVWEILRSCYQLKRLELYVLPTSLTDDDLLSPTWTDDAAAAPSEAAAASQPAPAFRNPIFPFETLEFLHIQDASRSGSRRPPLGTSLTAAALRDVDKKFPNLTRLGLVGLGCRETECTEDIMEAITEALPPKLAHLALGPVLRTSTELLALLKATPTLTALDLAWHGGQLPEHDNEFPGALGLETLTAIAQQINPKLDIRDGSNGHFNILL
ncbi:hypothetical protein DIPPA_00496 [Diplonema papillatum]|nr:hypothetical protein DIPPA_00496 [Diplonema papillatum]